MNTTLVWQLVAAGCFGFSIASIYQQIFYYLRYKGELDAALATALAKMGRGTSTGPVQDDL